MEVKVKENNDNTSIYLSGRIDSSNAQEAGNAMLDIPAGKPVVVDMEELEYISSAGLRAVLKLKKAHKDLKIINTRSEVYEVFEMTGFTQMMDIQRAYRRISVEGCEEIGKGAKGTVYRLDADTVVKTYNDPESLPEILHEREVAKLALVLGVPTAISYDVAKVGDSYASVFEMVNAKSFAALLKEDPDNLETYAKEYVEVLKKIHETEVPEGKLPKIKDEFLDCAMAAKDFLGTDLFNKAYSLIDSVPDDNHMIHGDFHTKNIMKTDEEVLTIDMDTLCVGHPVFEMAQIWRAYIGFSLVDRGNVERFQGFTFEIAEKFWKRILALYYGTEDAAVIEEKENKCVIPALVRMLRFELRKKETSEESEKMKGICLEKLTRLMEKTDSLV